MLKIGKGPADNSGAISAIAVVGDYTAKITRKGAFGPLLQTLATDAARVSSNPNILKHEQDGDLALAWMAQNTDGSGPFKIVEWSRGERCVMQAKPNYWGPKPKLKRVIIRFMRESADQRMALESGDIDIAEGVLNVFLYQTQAIVATRKWVKGYVYNPMLESMYNFESVYKE